MTSRTCTAIVDPRSDGECGEPAHMDTGRCPEHLPEPEPPKVLALTLHRGLYDVGVFCTCLQKWHWGQVRADSITTARILAQPLINRMHRESSARWLRVAELAGMVAKVQRKRAGQRAKGG